MSALRVVVMARDRTGFSTLTNPAKPKLSENFYQGLGTDFIILMPSILSVVQLLLLCQQFC
ncbi:MAG: hypothetical protein CM1200mP14_10010 [Gammaproteobacteria bacterium]|nr:MAG: hypothetical protein CM1200mP14_10010 [Gammaproteobacteria bacterium]